MAVEVAQKNGSDTPHFLNLVHDKAAGENGGYTLMLRHNAMGEVPSEEDREYSTGSGYVSFPIANYIKEDTADIVIKWKSHKFMGSGHSLLQTEMRSYEVKWERSGFEQNPSKSSNRPW